ncbi:MAG: peptidoglycan DD-metalloendopeptidase family protein [Eubacteriales bacterium]|nr:peptidoglycan DD-metalloendopeptidase family protein [Eubacteriales bacterium]
MKRKNRYLLPRKDQHTKTDYNKLERFLDRMARRKMRENAVSDNVAVNEARRAAEKEAMDFKFGTGEMRGMTSREIKAAEKEYSLDKKEKLSVAGRAEKVAYTVRYGAGAALDWAESRRRPLLTAAFAALALVLVFFITTLSVGYNVSINGHEIGTVSDMNDLNDALDKLTALYNEAYDVKDLYFERSVTFEPAFTLFSRNIMNVNDIISKVDSFGLNLYFTGAAITVDGREAVWLKDRETAQDALDEFLKEYGMETDSKYEVLDVYESSFSSDLSVKDTTVQSDFVSSKRDAISFLYSLTVTEQSVAPRTPSANEISGGLATAMIFRVGTSEANDTEKLPLLKVTTVKEVRYQASVPYTTEQRESSAYYVTQNVLVQEGENGLKTVHSVITYENNKVVSEKILDETVVREPKPAIYCKGTRTLPSNMGMFVIPTTGNISALDKPGSHAGGKAVDIANGRAGDIFASAAGKVTYSGWWGTYGNAIMIQHPTGYATVYAHMAKLYVDVGAHVNQGDAIGYMGSTGRSTGTHLHFEIRNPSGQKDPILVWFPSLYVGKHLRALSDGE